VGTVGEGARGTKPFRSEVASTSISRGFRPPWFAWVSSHATGKPAMRYRGR